MQTKYCSAIIWMFQVCLNPGDRDHWGESWWHDPLFHMVHNQYYQNWPWGQKPESVFLFSWYFKVLFLLYLNWCLSLCTLFLEQPLTVYCFLGEHIKWHSLTDFKLSWWFLTLYYLNTPLETENITEWSYLGFGIHTCFSNAIIACISVRTPQDISI